MAETRRDAVYAALAFAAFVVLGALVSHVPPGSLDRAELGTFGVGVSVARAFTTFGRFPTYLALCTATLIFGLVRRAWLVRALIGIVGLIVVWQTSDLAKLIFHRPRPLHPILAETSFGYPSGHADLALFFYGLWAYYTWHSALAKSFRAAGVAVAAALIVIIGWSRLALGAHFPTDVIGGYLYGAGWLAIAIIASGRVRSSAPRSNSR